MGEKKINGRKRRRGEGKAVVLPFFWNVSELNEPLDEWGKSKGWEKETTRFFFKKINPPPPPEI